MDSIAIVILPFVLFSLARALLYRASGGWRATLGAALAAVAAWFALFWALIGLALGVASCDTHLRSPRTFSDAVAVWLLVLGYAWVVFRGRQAKQARTSTLLGIVGSGMLLLLAVALAVSFVPRR